MTRAFEELFYFTCLVFVFSDDAEGKALVWLSNYKLEMKEKALNCDCTIETFETNQSSNVEKAEGDLTQLSF